MVTDPASPDVPAAEAPAAVDPDTGEDLDTLVASLYGGPLTSFVERRGALARALRSAGRRDDATRVKAVRKPKVAAWALDAGRQADPAAAAELAAAAAGVGEAQSDGGDVRAAIARLREAETTVVDAARRASADHGQAVDASTLGAALRAVIGDPDALADLVAGHLVDTPTAGGLGLAFGPPDTAAAAKTPRPTTGKTPRPTTGRSARSRSTTRDEPDKDAEALAAAREALADAERRAAAAADAAQAATQAAADATGAARRAEDEAVAARRRADAAAETARQAQDEADRIAARREAAAAEVATATEALRRLDG